MHQSNKPAGIVLCGGMSKRMGQNKATLKLGDLTLTEIVINTLKPFCSEIILSVNSNEMDFLPYRKIYDKIKGIGPVAGFYSALSESGTDENIVLACDTPFINKDLLELLMANRRNSDIVLPFYSNRMQTTVGFFRKSIFTFVKSQIDSGNFKPYDIFRNCQLKQINITDENFPGAERIFHNINNPADYKKAIELYQNPAIT